MKQGRFLAMLLITAAMAFSSCGGGGGGDNGGSKGDGDGDTVINISLLSGVTLPYYNEIPVTAITETDQYTGTVTWSGSPVKFAATTVYTATITLTAKTGYTLNGVSANFFKVAGATSVENNSDSGVVKAVFPITGSLPATVINIAEISGIVAPVLGAVPVYTITETPQYTGTVRWDGGWDWSPRFGGQKAYTATITLTAKTGYTLIGVAGNFFTVSGTSVAATNSANSGLITAVFPATASVGAIGNSALGGKVAYILQSGDPGYVAGEQRGLIAATDDQGSGMKWAVEAYQSTAVGGTDTALGTGFVNTNRIVAQNGTGVTYAAGLARAYNGGGYTDWYLPSKDEVRKLYLNRTAIGGFLNRVYWSSSEVNSGSAWYNGFDYNNWFESEKFNVAQVRAVRTF